MCYIWYMMRFFKKYIREFSLQFVLLILVVIFYTIKQHDHKIVESEIAYLLNYVVAAYFVSYFLLPKFFYKKKFFLFVLFFIIVLGFVICVEELVVERIYFPDTKGRFFRGRLYNLAKCLPVITIITGFKFGWDALTKQRELDILRNTVQESELMYLKSQINPHFLFNNLNNLYAYALENSPKTPEIILELSAVLRYILYECRDDYVPLSKEIEHLSDFVKLSKLQLEERGDVVFLTNATEGTCLKIAPLILPVFVENAFKHCTSSQSNNVSIHIELQVSPEGLLTFKCRNSFSEQSNTENLSKGIGLENVKRRLEILYPGAYKLGIKISGGTYKVKLELQLKQS